MWCILLITWKHVDDDDDGDEILKKQQQILAEKANFMWEIPHAWHMQIFKQTQNPDVRNT